MSLEGYVDYRRREFCNDVKCPVQALLNKQEEGNPAYEEIRALCRTDCVRTTYEFHHWLIDKGFLIMKPKA